MNEINLTLPEAVLAVLYISLFASHDFASPKGALKPKMDVCDRAVEAIQEFLGESFPVPIRQLEDRVIGLVATKNQVHLIWAAGRALEGYHGPLNLNRKLSDLAQEILEADRPWGLNVKEQATLTIVSLVLQHPELIPAT